MVIADYDKIENFMKIDAQIDPKSHPKIGLGDTSSMFFCLFHPLVCGMVNYMFSVSGRVGQKNVLSHPRGAKNQTGSHGLRRKVKQGGTDSARTPISGKLFI